MFLSLYGACLSMRFLFFFFFLNIHREEGLGMENIFFIIVVIFAKIIHATSALWKGNIRFREVKRPAQGIWYFY